MKLLAELTAEDFEAHAVWESDSPSDAGAVVNPSTLVALTEAETGVLLAATEFQFADGSAARGYCSPIDDSGLDYLQPVIFVGEKQVPLWRPDLGAQAAAHVCRELGKPAGPVFPISWRSKVLVDGQVRAGRIESTDVGAG